VSSQYQTTVCTSAVGGPFLSSLLPLLARAVRLRVVDNRKCRDPRPPDIRVEIRAGVGGPGSEHHRIREHGGLHFSRETVRSECLEHFGVLESALCRLAQCHTPRQYFVSFHEEDQCTPICYGPSLRPDMRISSVGIQLEGRHEVDSMTMHIGSFVHDDAWARCSFG
jgi:hypothetical protein